MRVLLTGVGGPAGVSLARQLRRRGHWITGVDMREVPDAGVDLFRVVPAAAEPDYLPVLARLVRTCRIDVVIPTVSEELVRVARGHGGLGAQVVIGSTESVSTAADKYLTMRCLERHLVPVPWFGLPSGHRSPAAAVDAADGSIVVKPRRSRGGRGVQVIDPAAAELPETLAYWAGLDDRSIVQRFAPGLEYAPVLFRASDAGEPELCVVLEKTALREGRVGNAVAVRRPSATGARVEAVADVARRAVLAAGLTGPVDVDVRLDAAGAPLVLEVNARFGANSAAAPELLDAVLAHVTPTGAGVAAGGA
ncbi:ATP-grasp domain-containing protein [Intrasporangium sp.]|uniref:ATP-grasp domain-containing protein n=1 Tax=Intrasporangium sp. TaxID=1925024 RepID=UPI003221DD5F